MADSFLQAVAQRAADAPGAATPELHTLVMEQDRAALPDFSGEWLNTEIGPDPRTVEVFFEKGLEIGWFMRKAMQAANFACGKMKHFLQMSEDKMWMSTHLDPNGDKPTKTVAMNPLNGDTFFDEKGKNPCKIQWIFEDGEQPKLLFTPLYDEGCDKNLFVMVRSLMPDGRMKTELTYPNKPGSLNMYRIFQKQS